MAKPSKLPEWDTTQANSVEPDQAHKDEGWLAPAGVPEKPPFQTFNYWQNEVYRWFDEINIKGMLGYDNATDYIADLSYAVGSTGQLYQCKINNGPGSSIVNPVGDATGTWTKVNLTAQRSKFIWKDIDEIYLDAGVYHHVGTKEQMVYWDSQLTFQFSNLAASDWSYLYLDDSAIVTANTNLIAAGQLIDSLTEPTWNDAKKGLYNGEDKCIFAIRTDGSSEILEFWHANDYIAYDTFFTDLDDIDIDTSWTDVILTAPALGDNLKIQVTFRGNYITDIGGLVSWRKNGTGGSHNVIRITVSATDPMNSLPVIAELSGSNNIIEVVMEQTGLSRMYVYTDGWYLPIGM